MDKIILHNVGKKFNRQWIFRNLSLELNTGDHLAITGFNGSGKSTLLQIIAGYVTPTEGNIAWTAGNQELKRDEVFRSISFASPYYDLIEEYSFKELLLFHSAFKKISGNQHVEEIIRRAQLEKAAGKQLRSFSSGMKQRARLTLALTADVPFIFLDEPASNLDQSGIAWLKEMINDFCKEKIVMVCSNSPGDETASCTKQLAMERYLLAE